MPLHPLWSLHTQLNLIKHSFFLIFVCDAYLFLDDPGLSM